MLTHAAVAKETGEKVIARNKRAQFDYALEESWEAGIVLTGSEVKSLRASHAELVDAYATVEKGEAWLLQMHIAPFEMARHFGHETRRARKLLLHKSEIRKIEGHLKDRGYTLVPLRVYLKDGRVKVEIALARGRSKGDRRQAIAKKEAERETRVAMGRLHKERGR